jgi:hypothetical protein
VLDETCDLFVRERQRRTQKELPKNTAGSAALGAARPFQLVHSGELEFRVEKRYAKQVVRDAPGRPLEEHLNDVVVCLVNAALGEKEFRAAEQRARLAEVERERRQAAFKQQMQARRARFKHLEQLVAAAAHHKQLVAFAAELRDAIGEVNPKSELGRWLGWVEEHVKDSDVLQRFRNGRSSLTLYYCAATYEVDGIIKGGFTGRGPDHDEDQDLPESVAFTDVPMKGIHGGTMCVLIDVPKEAALPYEVFGDDSEYRRFRIPPEIVNQFSRRLYSD